MALLLIAATACSGPGPLAEEVNDPADGVAAGPDTGVASPEGQPTNLELVADLERVSAEVDDAIVRVAEACMADRGFSVHPPRTPAQPNGVADPDRIVVTSPTVAEATERGYGVGDSVDAPEEPPQEADDFSLLSTAEQDRYYAAMMGGGPGEPVGTDPDGRLTLGGCFGEARQAVFPPDGRAPANPVRTLEGVSNGVVNEMPAVVAALDGWRQCVAEAGYPQFADPADALRYAEYYHYPLGGRPGGPVPEGGPWPFDQARLMEIELATVDARCADEHGLREEQRVAAEQALTTAISTVEGQAVGFRQEMTAALERAQEVLEGS